MPLADHIWVLRTIALVPGSIAALLLGVHLYAISSPARRQRFSQGPMGLSRKRKKPKRHAMLNVSMLADTDAWIRSLGSRSLSTTLKVGGQIDKAWELHNVSVVVRPVSALGFRHLLVLFEHERRSYGVCRAALMAVMRFVVARSMCGVVDEYSAGGLGLVAWSHSIVKGDTLRAMWFYQSRAAVDRKLYVWHGVLRQAVARTCRLPAVRWLDLGPSDNERVAGAKTRFGFEDTDTWPSLCDYSGEFASDADLFASTDKRD